MTVLATRSTAVPAIRDDMPMGEIANFITKSGFFSDVREVAQAMVKIQAGREVGLPPVASMMSIHIIKGKVTFGSLTIGALIQRSGRFNYRVTEHTEQRCSIDFYDGAAKVGTSAFTVQDAVRAGLAGGDNYKKWPKAMLFARAISAGARAYCPGVFGGPIYTPDEVGARANPETGQIIDETPQRAPIARRRDVVADLNAELAQDKATEPEPVTEVVVEQPAPAEAPPPDLTWATFKPLADAKAMSLGWTPSELDNALAKAAKAKGERSHLAASADFYAGFLAAMGSDKLDRLRK